MNKIKNNIIINLKNLTLKPRRYILGIYLNKREDKMIISINKWGNSQGIRIPKSILEELKWKENEKLNMEIINGKIVIEKIKSRKNINEIFQGYDEEYEPINMDWGKPVGDEIW